MNRRGHPQSLVAKHPGNKNAVKAGVFSPETLAARIREVEAEMAARTVPEVRTDVLRREVASLAVLGEAMDRTLAEDGLIGRRGEPRRMVDLRLRLNEKLIRTVDRYAETSANPSASAEPQAAHAPSLADAIVEAHLRAPGATLTAAEFDPEVFLHAVIVNDDPVTRAADLLRARRMLTRRRNQPETCVCISTLKARDAAEFYEWVESSRASGTQSGHNDEELAAIVRFVARGESVNDLSVDDLSVYAQYWRTVDAVRDVMHEAEERGRHPSAADDEEARRRREGKPAVARFWNVLLSADRKVKTKDRLDAFAALDEMEALPRCTCKPDPELQLAELEEDAFCAYVIRMVSQRHYRAALVTAHYPETYVAVREAIDRVARRCARPGDVSSAPEAG